MSRPSCHGSQRVKNANMNSCYAATKTECQFKGDDTHIVNSLTLHSTTSEIFCFASGESVWSPFTPSPLKPSSSSSSSLESKLIDEVLGLCLTDNGPESGPMKRF